MTAQRWEKVDETFVVRLDFLLCLFH